MLLAERRIPPFAQPGWIYEIKFDGYRLLAGVDGGVVKLTTRNGVIASKWFPEIVEGMAKLRGWPHVAGQQQVPLAVAIVNGPCELENLNGLPPSTVIVTFTPEASDEPFV